MNAAPTPSEPRREYILAELRCALIKAKLAQCDIEAVATALTLRVVTPEQAVSIFWDSEAVRFLGLALAEGSP